MSPEVAKEDFLRRIKQYEAVYETITEPNLSYLRITNVGAQVTLCRIKGYLQSRIAFYLMNLHLKPRSIFFSRVCPQSLCGVPSQLVSLVIARRKSIQRGREDRRRRSVVGTWFAICESITQTDKRQYWRCPFDSTTDIASPFYFCFLFQSSNRFGPQPSNVQDKQPKISPIPNLPGSRWMSSMRVFVMV